MNHAHCLCSLLLGGLPLFHLLTPSTLPPAHPLLQLFPSPFPSHRVGVVQSDFAYTRRRVVSLLFVLLSFLLLLCIFFTSSTEWSLSLPFLTSHHLPLISFDPLIFFFRFLKVPPYVPCSPLLNVQTLSFIEGDRNVSLLLFACTVYMQKLRLFFWATI